MFWVINIVRKLNINIYRSKIKVKINEEKI